MKINLLGKGWAAILFTQLAVVAFPSSTNANTGMTLHTCQQQDVRGVITDSTGPLPGATILVKGTTTATIAGADGSFSIIANSGDVLIVEFMGYTRREIAVTTADLGTITLTEAVNALEEVTINAGYYNVSRKEATGSISRMGAEEMATQPTPNMLGAMQGRLPGVHIVQETGTPGGGFYIQVRGQNSMRPDAGQPLYVIDGVPYASDAVGGGPSMTILSSNTSPLTNINPNEIQSIEVLKDADATAIYGSRGANGVVLVTTKKGHPGKTRVSADLSRGFGQVAHFMDMMKTPQYLQMRAQAFANDGITAYPENAYDINGTWDASRNTNWQEKLLGGTSDMTKVSASLSGGSESTQFFFSGNYYNETSVFDRDFEYTKANGHISINHISGDKRLTTSFSGIYTFQDNFQPSTDLTTEAWILAPNAPALYTPDGSLNWENNTFENPLRHLNGHSKSQTYDLVSNGTLAYRIAKGLQAKASMGFTALNHNESSTFPSTTQNPSYGSGSESSNIFFTDSKRHSWIVEPQLAYDTTFKGIEMQLLAGATFQSLKNNQQTMAGYGFSSNSMIYNPSAATTLEVLGFDTSVYKYQALYARANFKYRDRYILNLTGRRDGSSRFGPDKRFASFGAFGAAWIFSREGFLSNSKILSFGKIRASYGTAGSDQIGNYQYLNTYSSGGAYYDGVIGLQPSRLYNADFGWESNQKFEAALEAGFVNDRVYLTLAWYRNRSSNQLVGIPLPGTTGFTTLQDNLSGVVENSGTEISIRTENIRLKDFSWSTALNLTVARNKLVSFPNLESSTYRNQYIIGQPLNIEKVYHFTGVDPQTGLYTFEDVNGDGLITQAEDQVFGKDLNPQFFGGLLNELRYKGWQLSFHIQFVKQENFNIPSTIGVPGTMVNQPAAQPVHWQQPGDITPAQLYTSGTNSEAQNAFYRYAASDAAITDASFIRLKNVSLSYTLPASWVGGVRCRIFAEGQNLFTITPYRGPDPEFRGIGFLPPLRMITVGLNIQL